MPLPMCWDICAFFANGLGVLECAMPLPQDQSTAAKRWKARYRCQSTACRKVSARCRCLCAGISAHSLPMDWGVLERAMPLPVLGYLRNSFATWLGWDISVFLSHLDGGT